MGCTAASMHSERRFLDFCADHQVPPTCKALGQCGLERGGKSWGQALSGGGHDAQSSQGPPSGPGPPALRPTLAGSLFWKPPPRQVRQLALAAGKKAADVTSVENAGKHIPHQDTWGNSLNSENPRLLRSLCCLDLLRCPAVWELCTLRETLQGPRDA